MSENTKAKNPLVKLRNILCIVIAVLTLGYIATTALPFINYTVEDKTTKEVKEESISLMSYLWVPYNYNDLGNTYLPRTFKAEFGTKYDVTKTIAIPLFAFIGALVSAVFMLVARKRFISLFFPALWGLVSLVGYFISPIMLLGISGTRMIHIILFGVTLLLSIAILLIYVKVGDYKYVPDPSKTKQLKLF